MPNTAKSTPAALDAAGRLKLLRWMLASRLTDEGELTLKRRGLGHFQLSSLGHEALAGVALAMHEGDWLHPHYRDRAICIGRGMTIEQFFLDYFAKRDSGTGGRQMPSHYNSRRHRIVSLSSPVATNMLQAVGMAMSLKERGVPEVVVAGSGDAATRSGETLEAIQHAGIEKLPVVFTIADNRWGISTCTTGKTFWTQPRSLYKDADGSLWFMSCRVEMADGLDPEKVYEASAIAMERARSGDGPTILVLNTERLGSHSSSDDQRIYRDAKELAEMAQRDPVKNYVEKLTKSGFVTAAQVEAMKAEIQAEVDAAGTRAKSAPDPDPAQVRNSAFAPLPEALPHTEQGLPALLPKRNGGLTMAQCISLVLSQEMRRNPRISLYGEDVEDPKGDVFSTTKGLSTEFAGRVRNSPLAEATIMGSAVGRAILGDLPVAAIQFVDFMGPALNQLLNEVITMYWRSKGDWNCPMVVMAPYGAYLPGLGPWHSQTNEAFFAHMPGMHVVIPSSPGDAAGLLRYALQCNRPVLFLYPKALLHGAEETVKEPGNECLVPFGKARVVRQGRDVTLVTWGNCVAISRQAAQRAAQDGVETEILDLRTIVPWDLQAVLDSVARTGRLLVVHEDAKTCGMAGEIIAEVVAAMHERLLAPPLRVTKTDDHNPYQFALELSILPSVDSVADTLRHLGTLRSRAGESAKPSGYASAGFAPVPPVSAAVSPRSSQRTEAPVAKAASGGPARVPVVVPKQSPTDEDATVIGFKVKVGETVKAGSPLVEMEANKGSYEIESPHGGKIVELHVREGERVRVNTPLLTIETSEADTQGHSHEAAGGPANVEVRLTPAQIQVGALALKSQREIPTVSVETEADITELVKQREALQKEFEAKFHVHVTITHLILWALVQTLKDEQHRNFRGRLDSTGEVLLVAPHVNVGFAAISQGDDLFAPVIREAGRLNIAELVKRARELTESVRTGSINTHALQGATVTLTNIGAFDATRGAPFVIPGQLAMLCAGSVLPRPRYTNKPGSKGELVAELRQTVSLNLVFDHRPFNGSHAAGFLRAIKTRLQALDLKQLMTEAAG